MKRRQEIGEMTGFFEARQDLRKRKEDEDQSHDGKMSSGVSESS